MWFFKSKSKEKQIDKDKIPNHIAFIMDGNGRWAKKRGMPRNFGHKKGVDAVKRVQQACSKFGVKAVSFFVFSTENWNRPKQEVDFIFSLVHDMFDDALKECNKEENKWKLVISGDLSKLEEKTRLKILEACDATKNNTGMVCNFAINYGGRDEILRACNALIEKGEEATKENFEKELYTFGLPDIDMVVRTSGEVRVSNFMLYQLAYSELFFIKKYWPDMDKTDVENLLIDFQKRNRRFGKI